MHQTRKESSMKLPIKRKGTKYLARALRNINDSVPVVIALREMLGLAKTSKEVKKMIQQRVLKINGKLVKDLHDSICLFNIFEADKTYCLSILPTGRFYFKEIKKSEDRLCRVINKTLVKKGKIQITLHDGTNFISNDKNINMGCSVYLDNEGKVKSFHSFEKNKKVFVFSGRHLGSSGVIGDIKGRKINVKFDNGGIAELNKDSMFIIK